MEKFNAESLPKAFVDKDVLYIAIGINYIKHTAESGPLSNGNGDGFKAKLEWNAEQAFSMEVADELNSELGDDGTTLINIALDGAVERAIEAGSAYVKVEGEDE